MTIFDNIVSFIIDYLFVPVIWILMAIFVWAVGFIFFVNHPTVFKWIVSVIGLIIFFSYYIFIFNKLISRKYELKKDFFISLIPFKEWIVEGTRFVFYLMRLDRIIIAYKNLKTVNEFKKEQIKARLEKMG